MKGDQHGRAKPSELSRAWSVALLGFASFLFVSCVSTRASSLADLGQGWTQAQRDIWYEQTQGSRLIPYRWAQALEVAGSRERFFSAANMRRYGYLPAEATSLSGLPVGFTIDAQRDGNFGFSRLRWYKGQKDREAWLGMNCAACHTSEVEVAGKPLRIDGGGTLADFQSMIDDFNLALHATFEDPNKFDRFASGVLKRGNPQRPISPTDRQLLKSALSKLIQWQDKVASANHGGAATWPGPKYGNGRLDAFGHIFNKVALFVGADHQTFNASTAPVSYPFIWNTSQSDKVQWNGIAANRSIRPFPGGNEFDYGALGRNAGEVTGVFADVNLHAGAGLGGYNSSVQVQRLSELERLLARLRPPRWPTAFGVVDTAPGRLADRGRKLFAQRCAGCHTRLEPTDLHIKFVAPISLFRATAPNNIPPGTDPWMACNAYTYQIRTGVLQGTRRDLISGERLGAVEPTARVLETVVKGELARQKRELVKAATKAIFGSAPAPRPVPPGAFVSPEQDRARRLQICMSADSPFLGYKSRPLTGIWATAPYLHNGSVPTLYDLLLPAAQRPRAFYVGSHRFDPRKVGFVTAPAADNSFRFVTHDSAGNPIAGNSNQGHDYDNASLTENDRWALVEYLKSL